MFAQMVSFFRSLLPNDEIKWKGEPLSARFSLDSYPEGEICGPRLFLTHNGVNLFFHIRKGVGEQPPLFHIIPPFGKEGEWETVKYQPELGTFVLLRQTMAPFVETNDLKVALTDLLNRGYFQDLVETVEPHTS